MKNKRKHWNSSLRKFSWSSNENKTKGQTLAEATLLEWYNAKHRKTSKEETDYINSLTTDGCPYCRNNRFVKNGYSELRIQTYKCLDCSKRFNILTNTIFDSKKIPISEWIEYLIHLFEFHSLKTSARDNRNSDSTGKYWLYKIFEVLKHYQDNIMLKDVIYIDELFFSVIKSKTILKNVKQLRGISKNKICVSVGTDGINNIAISQGVSKPSKYSCLNTYKIILLKVLY